MTHGFNLSSELVCEGIIGDGCGGGRFFLVQNETLKAYDPITEEYLTLLKEVQNAKNISKSKCIISIVCEKEKIEFDLSSMSKTTTEI